MRDFGFRMGQMFSCNEPKDVCPILEPPAKTPAGGPARVAGTGEQWQQ
jgi:hypothetical protein